MGRFRVKEISSECQSSSGSGSIDNVDAVTSEPIDCSNSRVRWLRAMSYDVGGIMLNNIVWGRCVNKGQCGG